MTENVLETYFHIEGIENFPLTAYLFGLFGLQLLLLPL